jgi:hypothetical protein
LIRAYQYVVAKFDVDGFRIDSLMYVPADFERVFANAMREYALSAGKKNFFTFGRAAHVFAATPSVSLLLVEALRRWLGTWALPAAS